MNIHYNESTGQIMAYDTADDADGADSYLEGCKVLAVPLQDVNARRQRIDPATRSIVDKAAPDPEPSTLPQPFKLKE